MAAGDDMYQSLVELEPIGEQHGSGAHASVLPMQAPTWKQRLWRYGNLAMQFQPYFLMWYGFWLIVNDIVGAHCDAELQNCRVPDFDREGLDPVVNSSVSRDMFTCPHTSFTDKESSGKAVASFMLLAGLLTVGVVGVQFMLMTTRVKGHKTSSLRYIAWLEVAKERGSLFMRLSQLSAVVICAASVVAIFDKFGTGQHVGDMLNVVFQGGTSLYTAYLLVTYESPIQTQYHARSCPDVPVEYSWWDTSADVMVRLHYILALDKALAHELIGIGGGSSERLQKVLRERNLNLDLADMLAGFGEGSAGRATLERVRRYLSHPPTQAEVGSAARGEAAEADGAAEVNELLRANELESVAALQSTVELLNHNCGELERKLAAAEDELDALRDRAAAGGGDGPWEGTIEALHSHCAELEAKLEEAPDREHCEALEHTVAQLNERCEELEALLAQRRGGPVHTPAD